MFEQVAALQLIPSDPPVQCSCYLPYLDVCYIHVHIINSDSVTNDSAAVCTDIDLIFG